jgi:predicted nucleic acid-binding protein
LKRESFVYFDTSTWLKLYVREEGSDAARALAKHNSLFSSAILLTEAFSALHRKREAREISDGNLRKLVRTMEEDVSGIKIVNLGAEVFATSQEVVLATSARALDALHIASALVVQNMAEIPLTFVTADRRQFEAARDRGLTAIFT